jgi:hypothetical protein
MSPSTRALLAAAREGLGPDAAAAARVKAKLDALLAAPAAAAASAAPAAAAGGGAAVKLGVAVKLAAAVALTTAGAAVVIAVPTSRGEPTVARAPALDEVTTVERPSIRVRAPAIVRDEVVAPLVEREPTPIKHVRVAPPVAPPPLPEVSLAREVQLIDDAMASLRSGHPTEALAAVAAYHRETGDRGQLAEEASAIEIEASCTLHVDVRDKLAAFDRTWPSSAQRARLTAACH